MPGSIHMHMHPAAVIYNCSRMPERADHLLQLFHFAVFQLGAVHFHAVPTVVYHSLPPAFPVCHVNTAVVYEPPFLPLIVNDFPWIVSTGFARLTGRRPEQGRHCLAACSRVIPVISISHPKYWSFKSILVHSSSSLCTAASRLPMASTTVTVTPLPACLYTWLSDWMASTLSICSSCQP